MRTDFIKIYKSVHTWTGILSGMALFIAFYAGALTVFKEPLARWVAPPSVSTPVTLAEAPALISRTLAARPAAARDFELNLQLDESTRQLQWQERAPGQDDHDALGGRHYSASLDASGAAQIEETRPSQLADFIDILHRVVGLPFDNDPSRWLMGLICTLYALALVSGVIVLLPTLVKDLFALRVGKNLKRMWLDAHNVVGLFSLPFHIIMAITAVVFAYHDDIYALQNKLLHDGQLASAFSAQRTAPKQTAPRDPASMLAPLDLLARARDIAPDFSPSALQYVNVTGPRAMVRIWGHDASAPSPRAMGGFIALEPYSGKVLSRDFLPGQQSAANLTLASFFALHFATFGGDSVRWMYFLLALAGAWLFYSGNLLWVESRRKKQRSGEALPAQRRDTQWLAAGTVGVCLGCVSGISLSIVAGKWLYGHVTDLNAWHWYVYYAVFFASIAWAFARGAAQAAVQLLWLAAASTLCIPASSLLGWALPALGLWANTSTAALGVDATALAGALCFMWMARATARRVESGPAASVWSAPAANSAA
jgi:uncharacterized iron-regulated membrane protein